MNAKVLKFPTKEERTARKPLPEDYLKETSEPHFKRPDADDFGDRMQRIKISLEKINRLMTELKKTGIKGEYED